MAQTISTRVHYAACKGQSSVRERVHTDLAAYFNLRRQRQAVPHALAMRLRCVFTRILKPTVAGFFRDALLSPDGVNLPKMQRRCTITILSPCSQCGNDHKHCICPLFTPID